MRYHISRSRIIRSLYENVLFKMSTGPFCLSNYFTEALNESANDTQYSHHQRYSNNQPLNCRTVPLSWRQRSYLCENFDPKTPYIPYRVHTSYCTDSVECR